MTNADGFHLRSVTVVEGRVRMMQADIPANQSARRKKIGENSAMANQRK
jgi:hypothetical protein